MLPGKEGRDIHRVFVTSYEEKDNAEGSGVVKRIILQLILETTRISTKIFKTKYFILQLIMF